MFILKLNMTIQHEKVIIIRRRKKIILKQYHEQNLGNGASSVRIMSVQIKSVRIVTVWKYFTSCLS
jgi:hypothetical protein